MNGSNRLMSSRRAGWTAFISLVVAGLTACGENIEAPAAKNPRVPLSVVVAGTVEADGEPQEAIVMLKMLDPGGPPCTGGVHAEDSLRSAVDGTFESLLTADTAHLPSDTGSEFEGCLMLIAHPVGGDGWTDASRSDVWLRKESEVDTVEFTIDVSHLLGAGAP